MNYESQDAIKLYNLTVLTLKLFPLTKPYSNPTNELHHKLPISMYDYKRFDSEFVPLQQGQTYEYWFDIIHSVDKRKLLKLELLNRVPQLIAFLKLHKEVLIIIEGE